MAFFNRHTFRNSCSRDFLPFLYIEERTWIFDRLYYSRVRILLYCPPSQDRVDATFFCSFFLILATFVQTFEYQSIK